ncbi:hypothetical protein, partial [Mycobacterium talmoniae]|uniref:hypothetical protein n=1 Tax=Mycobacterium talmoniae TaxID=1858794 RepID=UPI0013F4F6B3
TAPTDTPAPADRDPAATHHNYDWTTLAEHLHTLTTTLEPPQLTTLDHIRITAAAHHHHRTQLTTTAQQLTTLAKTALEAGATKTTITQTAHITRPTLNTWLNKTNNTGSSCGDDNEPY